jgi:hypothetical protein
LQRRSPPKLKELILRKFVSKYYGDYILQEGGNEKYVGQEPRFRALEVILLVFLIIIIMNFLKNISKIRSIHSQVK